MQYYYFSFSNADSFEGGLISSPAPVGFPISGAQKSLFDSKKFLGPRIISWGEISKAEFEAMKEYRGEGSEIRYFYSAD